MASLHKAYLLVYNLCQAVGWASVLFQVIEGVRKTGSLTGAYASAGDTVGMSVNDYHNAEGISLSSNLISHAHHHRFLTLSYAALFQLASALEIVHAAIGLVGGSPINALMQWAGRSNVLFAIVHSVPEVQASPAVGAMLLAWALSEVIRYPWYAATTAGLCPYWLTWLRYTAFIPLYPVGVVGEMHAVYLALPYIAQRKLHYVTLPNAWNLGFDYKLFMTVSAVVGKFDLIFFEDGGSNKF